MRMSLADDASTTRRAALGAILGGAIAVPSKKPRMNRQVPFRPLFSGLRLELCNSSLSTRCLTHRLAGTAFAYLSGAKGLDRNYQLKSGGVLTDVVSSSMAGTRVSAFKSAIIGNQETAKKFARPPISGESP